MKNYSVQIYTAAYGIGYYKKRRRFCGYDLSKKMNFFGTLFETLLERFWNIEDSKTEDILK